MCGALSQSNVSSRGRELHQVRPSHFQGGPTTRGARVRVGPPRQAMPAILPQGNFQRIIEVNRGRNRDRDRSLPLALQDLTFFQNRFFFEKIINQICFPAIQIL